MRGGFIFYRSFQEAINEASDADQLLIYRAIANYSLDQIEPELNGVAKLAWLLIKPQLEANWKRYEAGVEHGHKGAEHGKKGGRPKKAKEDKNNPLIEEEEPSKNPLKTLSKPTKDKDKDKEERNKEIPSNEGIKKEPEGSSCSPEFQKFEEWIKRKAPFCSNPKNFPNQITEAELLKLKEKYSGKQIADVIEQIENRKDLRNRYTNLYRTVLNWAKKEYGDGESDKPLDW